MNSETNLAQRIELRPVEMPADEEFLIELFYTTRDDIQLADIDEEQKRAFSLMQYNARKQHYEKYYPGSKHDIILLDGKRVGQYWTSSEETEIIGVDLSILPEYRNLGIGTLMLTNSFDEAEKTGRVFNFHVLKMNTNAIRLYERLDCKYIESEAPTHFKMQWRPNNKNERRNR